MSLLMHSPGDLQTRFGMIMQFKENASKSFLKEKGIDFHLRFSLMLFLKNKVSTEINSELVKITWMKTTNLG